LADTSVEGRLEVLPLMPNLEAAILHRTKISGTLPNISSLQQLQHLTLHDNNLGGWVAEGCLPPRMTTFTLHGNHLSCKLPNLTSQATNISTQLILPGNWFDWKPPDWVQYRESALCVDQAEQRLDLWIWSSTSISAGIFAFPVLLAAGRNLPLVVASLWQKMPSAGWEQLELQYLALLSALVLKCLILPSCCAMALAASYYVGSGFFQCGPVVAKVTVSSMVFSGEMDRVLVALISVWLLSVAFATASFARVCSRSSAPRESRVARNWCEWSSRLLWKMAWVIGLLTMSIPTVIFVASDWLPDDNYFKLKSDTVDRMQWIGSQILALVANFGVPWLTGVCRRSGISPTVSQLLGRTLVVWVVPLCASVSMADGCYRGWARWWNPCLPGTGTFDKYANIRGNRIQVLSQEAVCGSPPEWGRCTRDVIGNLSVLYTRKMFLSAFQIPFLRLAVNIYQHKMGRDVEHSFEEAVGSLVTAVDFALVLGLAFPALVPLCAATVLTTTLCQRLSVHMCSAEIVCRSVHGVYSECDFDTVQREVSLYFVFSHVLQCIIIPSAFFEMGVLGSNIWQVFMVASVSLGVMLLLLLRPRASEMQPSRGGEIELLEFR